MGPLSLALPISTFLYLLPSVPNIASNLGKVATTVIEQSNDGVSDIDLPKKAYKNNGKVEPEQSFSNGGSIVYPLEILKPMMSSDATKVNVDFQAKVKSKKYPDHAGISTNVRLANQAKWSSDESSDERLSTEEQIKSLTGASKHEGTKDANGFHLYIPDIANTLKEHADVNIPLGSRNTARKNYVDNRVEKRKGNYIRLCRRSIDGSSLMQKLRGKNCVKLPRSEFYLEHDTRDANRKEDTIKNELNIETKVNDEEDYKDVESDEYKQRNGAIEASIVEASISDGSINYEEELDSKSAGNLGSLTLIGKKHVINNKIGNRLHGKFTRRH